MADETARAIADRVHRERSIKPFAQRLGRIDAEELAVLFVRPSAVFRVFRLLYPLELWTGDMEANARA